MLLYLHIPFCHRICPYCSFYKHTPADTHIPSFINALLLEAKNHVQTLGKNKLTTLYCGGGTPSMLSPTHLKKLFNGLQQIFDLSELQELTFEANPATFDLKKAQLFKQLGITRVSLGIQSFDNQILKINIDLMFSIPGQSIESWQDTLETAINLSPDHISAYNLTYEEDTPFINKLTNGEYIDNPETNAKYFTLTDTLLTEAGYQHYETSNYAKPNKHSTHNQSYWKGIDYLSLGPSAVATINGTRWKNTPDTAKYIHQINQVGHAKTEIENLTKEDLRIERIALLLRTTQGIPLTLLTDSEKQKLPHLTSEKLAKQTNTHLTLTKKGHLLTDAITEHLI